MDASFGAVIVAASATLRFLIISAHSNPSGLSATNPKTLRSERCMLYHVCIDIGGTFTDCLVSDDNGRIAIFKAPTTPGEFEKGFIDVLGVAADGFGLAPRDFISQIDIIVHGSTVSTNALVEGKTARAGLIVNHGHADILTLREGPRKGAFEWRLDYPEPYIPRKLTRTVRGRIDVRGREIVPLSLDDVHAAAEHFRLQRVESIAVGLLWSVADPRHELKVREILAGTLPDVPVTLSHEINPIPREYRRVIAAAIDASISPIIAKYVQRLQDALAAAGFGGELLLANCLGGMMPPAEMRRRPIYSVMSGPTLAPIAALALTEERDVIVGDMGGTSFDVSALRDHEVIIAQESRINNDLLGIPKVDVRSIGAGGGSIAHVDPGGLLHVGPHSAGARPGPACYGLGGVDATVTDANVVLGILDPDFFLGGRIRLDGSLAERAVDRIAQQLGIGREDAAHAIATTSNHNMVAAIEEITVREGINPRDSFFVCGGGGTPCHIAEMADILGLKRYLIPRFVAGLSAFGGLISDLRWEQSGTLHSSSRQFQPERINDLLGRLRQGGDDFMRAAGVPEEVRRFEYAFFGRYEYQSWEIEVRFDCPPAGLGESDLGTLVESFHQMHERIYSIRSDNDVVEFTTWKVRAIARRAGSQLWRSHSLKRQTEKPAPKGTRKVYMRENGGRQPLPVYDAHTLGAGAEIAGPCLVDANTFTAFLARKHIGTMDQYGNLLVEIR
jgi:N-methylhydantoinase A